MEWDKPFKTYSELIALMRFRNIVISDEHYAKQCLSDISYYSLINGYKHLFPSINDCFIQPIPFEIFPMMYHVENLLNNILFRYIMEIEHSLKSKLSYIISEKYGVFTDIDDLYNLNPNDYLYRNNYRGTRMRNNVLRRIKEEINRKHGESDIAHYLNKHNHLPCWILINNIPFGLAIKLLQIMTSDDKTFVCDAMVRFDGTIELKKDFLNISLIILKEYRNKIAHTKKIFVNTINEKLSRQLVFELSRDMLTYDDYENGYGKNDLFAVILIIMNLIRGVNGNMFIPTVIELFEPYENYSFMDNNIFDLLELPHDFLSILKQLDNQIIQKAVA